MLDARHKVHRVCDRFGGNGSPGFQVLVSVVGEGLTLAAWSLKERSGPWRLDPHKAAGVFFYRGESVIWRVRPVIWRVS